MRQRVVVVFTTVLGLVVLLATGATGAQGVASPATGEWLAGDLHVHTCASHDAYCGPDDKYTEPEKAYNTSGTVDERFLEASLRKLDYLAITDHHSDGAAFESGAESWKEPGFGGYGVIGVPGHENSLSGHGQMLGARHAYPAGDRSAAAVNAMADAMRAEDGGVLQANHPGGPGATCDDVSGMHWKYGYQVRVDTVEVWNGLYDEGAVAYWECWLQRGARVAPTGGSDTHSLFITAANGPGEPTTWTFAPDRTTAGVLAGIRAGRTSIAQRSPAEGGLLLLLEGDDDRDGTFEAIVGDTVAPGIPVRVRALGQPGAGQVRIRANGQTLVDDATLTPGGTVSAVAPATPGWVRAELREGPAVIAMTSALYVAQAPAAVVPEVPLAVTLPLAGMVAIVVSAVLRRRRQVLEAS